MVPVVLERAPKPGKGEAEKDGGKELKLSRRRISKEINKQRAHCALAACPQGRDHASGVVPLGRGYFALDASRPGARGHKVRGDR
jgi:hypothetical protein